MSTVKINPTSTPTPTPTPTPTSTETILDTTGKIGKIYGYMGFSCSICIVFCLCIGGCIALFTTDPIKNYVKINAIVIKSDCFVSSNNNRNNTLTYTCNLKCEYAVNNISYNTPITVSSPTPYAVDSHLDILYDPNDPSIIVEVPSVPKQTLGIILIVCGFILLLIALGYLYLTLKSSTFNKIQGIGGIANMI